MSLYRTDFERTERAHMYVDAVDAAEVEALIKQDAVEALPQSAWYCGDDPEVEYDAVRTTHGERFWRGTPRDGRWVEPDDGVPA